MRQDSAEAQSTKSGLWERHRTNSPDASSRRCKESKRETGTVWERTDEQTLGNHTNQSQCQDLVQVLMEIASDAAII